MTEPRTLTPGIHYDVPEDVYHGDPCVLPSLSSSLAKIMLAQSPRHAWTASPRLNPRWQPETKEAFDIGRAAHRAILGKGGDYVAIPNDLLASNGAASTKAAKEWIAEARAAGNTPLKEDVYNEVHDMALAAAARLEQMGITLEREWNEVTAIGEIDGVLCRARFDHFCEADYHKPIYDLKTCLDASPQACIRAVANYGYDIQAAHYLDVMRSATGLHPGIEPPPFRFVFQEKAEPFEVCVIELAAADLDLARRKIARAREMWRLCLERDEWPGYPPGIHQVSLPEWHHARWLERESQEDDYRRRTGQDVLAMAFQSQAPMEAA